MSEVDLAKRVISWLVEQHWDVYQEVMFGHGAIADIVAVRAGYLWIIECKAAMTFTVLEQAEHWHSHYRSVAIPAAQRRNGRDFANEIARGLGIGVIEIGQMSITQQVQPVLHRDFHSQSKRLISKLKEEHKTYSPAGSANGGYFTPYKQTIADAKRFISYHPGCTLKEIMVDLHHHYASDTSAKTCLRVALANWESNWCEVKMDVNKCRYYIKAIVT